MHALFRAARDILVQHNTEFEIGRLTRSADIDGKKVVTERQLAFHPYLGIYDEQYRQYEIKSVIYDLYEPHVLLHNLVSALLQAAEQNKEKIKQLEFALRFVKVLSDDNTKNSEQ